MISTYQGIAVGFRFGILRAAGQENKQTGRGGTAGPRQHSSAQHSSAQHGSAQHGTAQHGSTAGSGLTIQGLPLVLVVEMFFMLSINMVERAWISAAGMGPVGKESLVTYERRLVPSALSTLVKSWTAGGQITNHKHRTYHEPE